MLTGYEARPGPRRRYWRGPRVRRSKHDEEAYPDIWKVCVFQRVPGRCEGLVSAARNDRELSHRRVCEKSYDQRARENPRTWRAPGVVAEVNLGGDRSGENNHASAQRSGMRDVAYLALCLADTV